MNWRDSRILRFLYGNRKWLFSGSGRAIVTGIFAAAGGLLFGIVWPHFRAGASDDVRVRILSGPDEINDAVESLTASSSKQVQLLIQVLAPKPHLPDTLAETMALHMSERKRRGKPIKYDPLLVFDGDHPTKGLTKFLIARGEIFSRHGVKEFVQPRFLDQKHSFGVDILIVDRQHMLIALNTVPAAEGTQIAYLFKDQPKIASEFADWFEHVLLPSAKSIDDWIQAHPETP